MIKYSFFLAILVSFKNEKSAKMPLYAKTPGTIGKSAGNAMISAGTFSRLAKSMPKIPLIKETMSVATLMLKNPICMIQKRLACANAASKAQKMRVLFGGELA